MERILRRVGYSLLLLSLGVVWFALTPASAQTSATEIVLYASTASAKVGNFSNVADATAAGGARIHNSDAGAAKLATALVNPSSYFEMTFNAQAGVPYRLWVRAKADNNSPYNDSYFVQFSGSVTSTGSPVFRIGTTDATVINQEDCSGCGLSGWGWQDNGWGVGVLGPVIYFQSTGTQTLRVHAREDGFSIDQIILSSQTYFNASPGALKNDTTIVPQPSTAPPPAPAPAVTSIAPNFGSTSGGTLIYLAGTNFSAGATVRFGGVPATNVNVANHMSLSATTPPHAAGTVSVEVTNPDNQSATLANAFTFNAPPSPAPSVSAVSPNSGSTNGGTSVTITGSGFVSGASVNIGGVFATNVNVSSTTITATTPAHAAGAVSIVVTNPNSQSATLTNGFTFNLASLIPDEVVLYAAQASVKAGNFSVVSDPTAAGGSRIYNLDAGAAKLANPLANPAHYFEMTFNAQAGVPYRLWVRSKAVNNSPYNDSYFVQFSGSVTLGGNASFRIGTTNATVINQEECSGCGLSNWGWQDNGWGVSVLGEYIFFQSNGTQTLRLQPREDGFSIDQIVLSPVNYLILSPGALWNDTRILPSTGGGTPPPPPPVNQPPQLSISASTTSGTTPLPVNFVANASDPDGYINSYSWNFGDGGTSTQASPSHTYTSTGTFTAQLTVTDNGGAATTRTVTITVSSPAPPPPNGVSLRIVSFNGAFGKGTDNIYDLNRQATYIANQSPDVVGICELENNGVENMPQTMTNLLTQKTGTTWNYYFVPKFPGCAEGNLIITKWQVVSTSYRYLSYQRSVAQMTINVNGKLINFFATHLDHTSSTYRNIEVGELKSFMSGFAEPRFVVGDFNAGPDLSEITQMTSSYYDSWNEAMIAGSATAYPDNPVVWMTRTRRGRLDYVFYSRGQSNVTLTSANIPDQRDLNRTPVILLGTLDDRGVRPSDHNMMIATFQVR
jgi:endonuclease/exonuclease/phosphatase family metal-dependent hydrolase